MAGHKKLSGKQEEICFRVSLALCRHVSPETGSLKNRLQAYAQVACELGQLGVLPRYVGDIWRRHKGAIVDSLIHDLMEELKHKKGAGAPRRISVEELHAQVRSVEWNFCKDFCTLAQKIGVPTTTLHRAVKQGLLWTTKSHIKPMLTEANKAARVTCCLWNVQNNCFTSMFNHVDIDEKWFYLFQVNTKYILVPGEKPPHRVCRHKSHIPKAMCLTAVACPCPNPVTGVWWDGKIGTWFFVEQVPAVRSSRN